MKGKVRLKDKEQQPEGLQSLIQWRTSGDQLFRMNSAIRQPTVDANNFELKPALITMVQQQQFTGHPIEDPNEHLGRFLRMANTVKLNGVRPEAIKLHLFPFS